MWDEPIPLHRTRFRLSSSDASLHVRFEGGQFVVSGQAEGDGDLSLSSPTAHYQAGFAPGSGAKDAVARLEAAAEPDVLLHARTRGDEVTVRPVETISPAAPLPRVSVLAGDPGLLVYPRAVNSLLLRGAVEGRCLVTLRVDGRSATLQAEAGSTAAHLARLLAVYVPHGYRAEADGGLLTVWRDAGTTYIAA